ncbi:MAG TPA: HDOD domain-containing protein [Steroidobacteraceae bacterium]|nr:HDOD domain-containing protein [Steroidobacteraceae bacterium]
MGHIRLLQRDDEAPDPAFAFLQSLANDLSSRKLQLPSFPDVANRVRTALDEERVTLDQLARILSSEPVLAGRILNVANSAALNPGSRPVTELKTAIARLGHMAVRSVALAFAMSQIRAAQRVARLERELAGWWQNTTQVAALSFVIAKRCTRRSPDEAFLLGLLHAVGQLYILTRIADFPNLRGDSESLETILRGWHASIAKAIVENWALGDAFAEATGEQDDFTREHEGEADLADVLIAAKYMALEERQQESVFPIEKPPPGNIPALERLGLSLERRSAIVAESREEIETLRHALGP